MQNLTGSGIIVVYVVIAIRKVKLKLMQFNAIYATNLSVNFYAVTWYNLERSSIQSLSHKNESYHTLTLILQQIINTELMVK